MLPDPETERLGTKLPKTCDGHSKGRNFSSQETQFSDHCDLFPVALRPFPRFFGNFIIAVLQ